MNKQALFFAPLFTLCFPFELASEPVEKPNIILIYTDDQGFGDSSVLNPNAKFQTPNIDRLAKEGISFTNAHSPDAVCTPSRYALLTGRYAWRTRLKQSVLKADEPALITNDRQTIASVLQDNDYNTAMVGKWHLGMDIPGEFGNRDWSQPIKDMPLDAGFDYFYGIPASLNYGVLAWFEGRYAEIPPTLYTAKKPNDRHIDYRIIPPYFETPEEARALHNRQPIEVAPDFVDTECLDRFTSKTIEWIESVADDDKPFFVYVPYTSPHYPVAPLSEFHGQGEAGAYGEFMIETDYHIGRILEYLIESDLDENTMVIFSSDNGPENSWRKRIQEFGHHSNYTFRGGKRDVYEGGHRVPFFIRWPAGIQDPGRSYDGLIGQVDVFATIADLINAQVPDEAAEDSQSFISVLKDASPDFERLPLINHGFKGRMAITEGNWKLIFPLGDNGLELYDLSTDIAESQNLVDRWPEVVEELSAKATDIVLNGRTTPGDKQPNDTGYWDHLTWIEEEKYASEQN